MEEGKRDLVTGCSFPHTKKMKKPSLNIFRGGRGEEEGFGSAVSAYKQFRFPFFIRVRPNFPQKI